MPIGIGPPGLVHPSFPPSWSPSPRVGYHYGAGLGKCAGGSFPRKNGQRYGLHRKHGKGGRLPFQRAFRRAAGCSPRAYRRPAGQEAVVRDPKFGARDPSPHSVGTVKGLFAGAAPGPRPGGPRGSARALGPESVSGTAGAIAWEVRDIVQSVAVDGRAIRWDYRIIPRETSGTPVVFTTIEYRAQGSARSGLMATTTTTEFRRRLEANGQLERADNFTVIFTPNAVWSGFQNPATRELYTRYIRFIGQTEAGTPVSVMVAVRVLPQLKLEFLGCAECNARAGSDERLMGTRRYRQHSAGDKVAILRQVLLEGQAVSGAS